PITAGFTGVTVASEGLVKAVERCYLLTPETTTAIRRSLQPMLDQGVDAIVLGCTHYPFLKPTIHELAGDGVQIIDSGEGVARQTARVLATRNLLRKSERLGTLTVYTSGDPSVVGPLVRRLVGEDVEVKREG